MKGTLYKKFILVYLIFGFISFFTVSLLTSQLFMGQIVGTKADKLYQQANLVSREYASGYYDEETTLLQMNIQISTLKDYLDATILIVDKDGTIILDSEKGLGYSRENKIPGFDPAALGAGYYYMDHCFELFEEDVLWVISPITSGFQKQGYVIIYSTTAQLTAERDQMLRIAYISLVVIFFLSLLILAAFTVMVYQPLKKIIKGTQQYSQGDLKYEIPVYTEDEMGRLAASLNYMSAEIEKVEDYQKKFISNVSHDFRSPLTSIKGYAEAILDGTIPPEMYEKYLGIILSETERLNGLTQGLLTLNDFDTKSMPLEKTVFDINHVIKETAAVFEGTCKKRRISIELIKSSQNVMVYADIAKIQQVLHNLIDNAVKFSLDDSVICVETTEKQNKIFISVKDTGIGIPKDGLQKIWDRFYKTDLSRGKDKKGTGLGLSIVKEIIQAHNETIDVISTAGVGTEFIFSLSKGNS